MAPPWSKWVVVLLTISASFLMVPAIAFAACTPPAVGVDLSACPFTGDLFGGSADLFKVLGATFCIIRAALANAMFAIHACIIDAAAGPFRALLALYVIFYSMAVMLQITSGKDWAFRLIKVSLIYALALEPTMFYEYIFNFFVIALPDTLSGYLFQVGDKGDFAGVTTTAGVFEKLDVVFNTIVGGGNLEGIMVLAVAFLISLIGIPIVLFVLVPAFVIAFIAFIRIMIAYATSILALSFTLMFAPVFLAFLLFERTSMLFFEWLKAVINYSLELALVLFFVFLLGDITSLSSDIRALQDGSSLNRACDIKIADLGFAEAIEQVLPCFTSMDGILTLIYDMFFYTFAYLISSILIFMFMGKISDIALNLAKFNSPRSSVFSVISGKERSFSSLETAAKGIIAPIWDTAVQKAYEAKEGGAGRAKMPGQGLEKAESGIGKMQDGGKKMGDGAKKIGEGAKKIGEGSKDVAEGSAKAAEGTGKGVVGGGKAAVGVVTAVGDGGATLAEGLSTMGEGAAKAAEGTAQAAKGGVKIAEGAKDIAEGSKDIAEGAAKTAQGAKDTAQGAVETAKEATGKGGGSGEGSAKRSDVASSFTEQMKEAGKDAKQKDTPKTKGSPEGSKGDPKA